MCGLKPAPTLKQQQRREADSAAALRNDKTIEDQGMTNIAAVDDKVAVATGEAGPSLRSG
jgi:NADH:ubiquinone oxidoreductase subunit D